MTRSEDALETATSDASLARSKARSAEIDLAIDQDPSRFRILTGDRPTGHLHLGHYFGTLRNRVLLQNRGVETWILVADYQVITDRAGVADAVRDCLGCIARGQRGQHQQVGNLGSADRIEGDATLRVRLRLLQDLRGLIGAHAQLDRVTARLRHLLSVRAQQQRDFGQEGLGAREHGTLGGRAAVALVEALGDQACLLEVGELVLAHGHDVRLAEEDVGGLVDRVGQHEARHRAALGRLQLGLHGRVAVQLRLGDQGEERQHQLVEGRNRRVVEDRGPLGVDARGQVVGDEAEDALTDRAHAIAVGDHLVVGDQNPGLNAAVLQEHAVTQRAEVVAQVQVAGRAVTREDAETRGVLVDRQVDLGAAGLRAGQRGIRGCGFQGIFTASHA